MMDKAKRARLKAKGWVETTIDELFGLDEIDRQVVELRVRLAREVGTVGLAEARHHPTNSDGSISDPHRA